MILFLMMGNAVAQNADTSLVELTLQKSAVLPPGPKTASPFYETLKALAPCVLGNEGLCGLFYSNKARSLVLVEVCHIAPDSRKSVEVADEGIYIAQRGIVRKYAWFDRQFNKWACDNKAYPTEAKYAAVRMGNGFPKALILSYRINLSDGYFLIDVGPRELKILKHENYDSPS